MRIFFDILLFLAFFVAPFFVTAILAFIGLIFFSRYAEFLVVALFADLMYRGGNVHFLGMLLPFMLSALITFFIIEFSKAFIRARII